MASNLLTTVPNDLKVDGNIISTTFPGALSRYADIFGRLKIAAPTTIFWSNFLYDEEPLKWYQIATGNGARTGPVNANVTLTVTGNVSANKIFRQTRLYIPSIPGKSQLLFMTGILYNTIANGVTTYIGSYDSTVDKTGGNAAGKDLLEGSGHFFTANQTTGTITISVGQRTTVNTAGGTSAVVTQVDTLIARANWNIDKLDGTGSSGITIDFTKANIYVIERSSLVGSVRMGISYSGTTLWCHMFENEGKFNSTYSPRNTLPIRYEISSLANGGTGTMTQICSKAAIDGDLMEYKGLPFSTVRGVAVSVGAISEIFIYSLRLSDIRPRTYIKFNRIECVATTSTSQMVTVYIRYNSTLTGTTYTKVDANNRSAMTKSDTGTVTADGTLIKTINISAAGNNNAILDLGSIYLGSGVNGSSVASGTPLDNITITAARITGATTANVNVAINWDEF
jgi:hypothetical protein